MKRNLIILITAILLMSFQVKAQLGLHIGYNFAKVSGLTVPTGVSEKYLSSFSAGAFYDIDLIPLLNVRPGLMYSPKGMHWEKGDEFLKSKINYLELPVLAKLKLGPFYGLGGFYGAYALNGNTDTKLAGVETKKDIDFTADEIERFDYGMKFGLGFQFGLGPVHIFAQSDYSFGFKNINSGTGDEMKNNSIGVSAGVLLGFK